MKYTNPIIPGFHPDPSICRVGEDYYLVTSTFEFFPSIPVFHSKNLLDWEQIGFCVTENEYLPLTCGNPNASGIYAPTIRYNNGKFYVICTNVPTSDTTDKRYGNFIISTEDPSGEWSAPVWLDCPGIDPSLFFDDDGKVYYCGTSGGVYFCEINPDTGEILSEKKYLWSGTGGVAPEAPHIYKKDGWYYLMLAEGGTEYGHMESIARCKDIGGPYIPYENNPIISNRSLGLPIMATGHADLVEDENNNWWVVCLGIRPISYPFRHNLGRETNLAPVVWVDGWPIVGKDGVIDQEIETDLLKENVISKAISATSVPMPKGNDYYEFSDDFKGEKLDLRWNYQYNPEFEYYKLGEEGLNLKGKAVCISDAEVSTFVGLRQMHHNCSFRTKINFAPKNDGEEVGVTAYMNRNHHYDLAFVRVEDKNTLQVRRRIGTLWKVENQVIINTEEVYLEILASTDNYVFNYSTDGENFLNLGQGEVRYLTTEVGGMFTGNYLGIYATGNGKESTEVAKVKWVQYKNII